MDDIANRWIWLGFSLFLVAALSLDTYFLNKKNARSPSIRTAVAWTLVWVAAALIFNALLWFYLHHTAGTAIANQTALAFLTGYLIEKSLSVDNLFAFYLVFKQCQVPAAYQARIFSYGIWGAVIFRLILIGCGVSLIRHFHWVLYLMGLFLFFMGLQMLFASENRKALTERFIFKISARFFRFTDACHGKFFFVKKAGLWYATPLFLALIFIEMSDVVFAFDSIPAIFAITTDPFIVWSANVFAMLGLRALYFLLAGSVEQFYLLKYGIALILILIGLKMIAEPWWHISIVFSLMTMLAILLLSVSLSLWVRIA